MTEFQNKVREDTPRLVVKYKCIDGKDHFEWGVVGEIPILSIIGYIARVQIELHAVSEGYIDRDKECPEPALVIAWNSERYDFNWFVDPLIPTDPLIGILETIKTTIVMGRSAQRVAAQNRVILGRDGRPIN